MNLCLLHELGFDDLAPSYCTKSMLYIVIIGRGFNPHPIYVTGVCENEAFLSGVFGEDVEALRGDTFHGQ